MSGVQQSPIYYQCTSLDRQCQTMPVHRGARCFVEEKVDKRWNVELSQCVFLIMKVFFAKLTMINQLSRTSRRDSICPDLDERDKKGESRKILKWVARVKNFESLGWSR